jgi:LSD1 subclass zinc finger protein
MGAPRIDGGGGYWVAVACTFQCRSCGFAAPLDQLDIDGSVECAYCGLRQRFDASTWTDALEFAHAVGDLSGPEPEGRYPDPGVWIGADNPFRDVGETLTFSELRQTGMHVVDGMTIPRSLQIQASPGFPVCRKCRVPLLLQITADGSVKTTCSTCSESAVYALPERARSFGEALVAVVADEHRVDKRQATETAANESNVAALVCPSCGAPLALHGGDRTIKCQFCGAFCRVPGRYLLRAGQEKIDPEVWWMLFTGRSAKRRELEGGSSDDKSVGIEVPPMEQGISYKQWLINLAFLLGALWLGFEIAATDALRSLAPADPPVKVTSAPSPAPTAKPTTRTKALK